MDYRSFNLVLNDLKYGHSEDFKLVYAVFSLRTHHAVIEEILVASGLG